MSSETFSGQESVLPDINVDPDILLDLCCGCIDGASPCIYCSLRRKGELSVRKFRQVPGKVYGNHTNEEGSCASMLCEVTFTSFKIHGASSSMPLVSLLDPLVDIAYPPAGLKDPCTLSICRRGPGNVNELWYISAANEADARDWFSVIKAPRPKHATASCVNHMKVQRFLMRSSGAFLPDPASDALIKQTRSYWAAADRFAGANPNVPSYHRVTCLHFDPPLYPMLAIRNRKRDAEADAVELVGQGCAQHRLRHSSHNQSQVCLAVSFFCPVARQLCRMQLTRTYPDSVSCALCSLDPKDRECWMWSCPALTIKLMPWF